MVNEWWVSLVEFNQCHIWDINFVNKDIENVSLYMDRSEFIDDDVNDGRISDVLRCIAWLS